MYMVRQCNYLFISLSSPLPPAQVTRTAAAQIALPWGALNLSLLTPPSRTAPPNVHPHSPGRNQEGFHGLPLPLLLMARRVQASGLQVQNPHQRRMQQKTDVESDCQSVASVTGPENASPPTDLTKKSSYSLSELKRSSGSSLRSIPSAEGNFQGLLGHHCVYCEVSENMRCI